MGSLPREMHVSICMQTLAQSFQLTDALKPAIKKFKGLDLFSLPQLPFFVTFQEASFQGDTLVLISQILMESAKTWAGY